MAANRPVPGTGSCISIAGVGPERVPRGAGEHWGPGASPLQGPVALARVVPDPMPGAMVGRCPAMERLFLQMRYLAGHLRIASIEGERGSGRRTVAETLHALGPAREGAFLQGKAAQLMRPPELARALARSGGGTLYLQQVDALDAAGQEVLLRLLRWVRGSCGALEGMRASLPETLPAFGTPQGDASAVHAVSGVEMSGMEKPPRAVLVSSWRPLPLLAAHGRFRADLLQQLALVQLRIPPLRERAADLELLAGVFAAEASAHRGKEVHGIARDAIERLYGQLWPGNVAELRLVMHDAAARASGVWVQGCDLRLPWIGPERTGADVRVQEPTLSESAGGEAGVGFGAPAILAALPSNVLISISPPSMQTPWAHPWQVQSRDSRPERAGIAECGACSSQDGSRSTAFAGQKTGAGRAF